MKVNENIIPVEQVNTMESIEFTIKFDAKMAALLGDKLYSNKIKSLIRELSCNAIDSHVVAKQTRPFEVILPTRFDTTFTLRDFGTGLTPQQVHDVYTTYGASDKTSSNKLVGCMGLGSKTPACYNTKSATIDSYVNGMHWSYLFHLGEKGIPCLTKLLEESTMEPNGVKITIPVNPSDIYTFQKEAEEIYRWFKDRPNVKPALNYHSIDKLLDHRKADQTSVLMGNVLYPVDDFGLSSELKIIYNCRVVLEVKIGECEPSISRESLSYTNDTKRTIVKYLEKIRKDITSKDLYKDCKSYHQARITWMKSGLPIEFKPLFPYNGKDVDLRMRNDNLFIYDGHSQFTCTSRHWNTARDYPVYYKDVWNAKQRIRDSSNGAYLLFDNAQTVLDELGLIPDDIINASTLTYTPTKRQKYTDLASKKWYYTSWSAERIKETDNIIYVTGDAPPNKYYFGASYDNARKLDKSLEVYFISNKVYEKIKGKSNFVAMEDHVQKLIKTKTQIIENYDKMIGIARHPWNQIIPNIGRMPKHVQDELKDYVGLKVSGDDSSVYEVAVSLKLYTPMKHTVLNDFLERYPLLVYLSYSTPIELISKVLEK